MGVVEMEEKGVKYKSVNTHDSQSIHLTDFSDPLTLPVATL